ncbi:MAG: alanine--tRNA ligase [Phycisphaerales bacterium]
MDRSAAAVRQAFIDFFTERHGHTFAPSSPVVPHDDPTLLFTNAGMNQFKDVFLETGTRPYSRAVNSQKCIRAGGKHNDLEDVGRDTYHHTFFEMLGNWSFGDFFKEEAIDWAWELLTGVFGLDPKRLHATVFAGDAADGLEADEEAERLWLRFLPREQVTRHSKKDNFWEMGDTGPCGPCSELHYDNTPDGNGAHLVNLDDPRVIEIWNLVFIQFNRGDGGALAPLPARHIDTGMGFERLLAVLQGKVSNYDTDLWSPIFDAIAARTGARPYGGDMADAVDTAYRVLADHIRCLSVAIADGAAPSNEGRGYVLRRILRRAVRHGRQTLGSEGPLLCELVPAVVDTLGGAFPELATQADTIAATIRGEEEAFLRTLDRGIALFDEAAGRSAGATISADDAFRLHDTFGFPVDLTRVMAEERGMTVDESGYESLMEAARVQSRAGGETCETRLQLPPDALGRLETNSIKPTVERRRDEARPVNTTLEAIWNGRDFDETLHVGSRVGVVFAETNHYAEAGGQVADHGHFMLETGSGDAAAPAVFRVEDVQRFGGWVLHIGHLSEGSLRVGASGTLTVERDRRAMIEPNHTATHLMNRALREVIGDGADQRGSLVAPDRLRFDFTSRAGLDTEQLAAVEAHVRATITAGHPVHAELAPLESAQAIKGLRAVFGERYPDPVRVVSIGTPVGELLAAPDDARWAEQSIEFCGGTHVADTSAIAEFVILREEALAAGVRRISAVTGVAAKAARVAAAQLTEQMDAAEAADDADLSPRIDAIQTAFDGLTIGAVDRAALQPRLDGLRERQRKVRKQAAAANRGDIVEQARELAESADGAYLVGRIDGADKDAMLAAVDVIRARQPELPAMLFSVDADAGKVAISALCPKTAIAAGLKAGDWVREAAKACGGGGGGRPDMAQAGGKDPARAEAAMDAARAFAANALS